ncbi:hypothetical protein AB0B31_00970 [Catellatospora citrea]|uniref:hypothetical protein n=1 Tax=Catellatospora citrea TaxID=53366 RepID=UPI0033F65CA0
MSRTAHHLPFRHQDSRQEITPLRIAELTDLRYSHACRREARREGRRPQPRRLRHRSEVYLFARWFPNWGEGIARHARHDERKARQQLRRALTAARRAPRDPDLDVPPFRHRHHAHWLS